MVARNLVVTPMASSSKELEESMAIVRAGLSSPPQTERELYLWLRALTGEPIPFKRVCANHFSPWDMLWEAYRVDLKGHEDAKKMQICVGPRDGLKTYTLAKLCAAELLLKPGSETCFVAAVDLQASRCTKYMRRYLAHPAVKHLVDRAVAHHFNMKNGASYEQLVGGVNAVNSPHPHKCRTDEVEMVKPREILEDMKMMPTSYGGINQHQLYCSTRKFVKGNMSWLFNEARPSSTKKMVWCYKEISEPCPDSRSGTKKRTYEVPDLYHPGETLVIEAYEGCNECPLLPSCRGDLKKARGMTSIDDLIESYHKLSREAWLIQKECIEPMHTDQFFEEWDEEKQVGDYPYNPALPLDLSFDFSGGGEDPTSVGFMQTDGMNQFRVHEMIFRRKLASTIGQQVETWCKERKIVPKLMIGDSAQQQFMAELRDTSSFFKHLRGTRKIGRIERLSLCKRFVRDNLGVRRLFVNKTCKNFIEEMAEAHRRESDPDDLLGEDHSIDDWGYWVVEKFYHGKEPNIRWLDWEVRSKGAPAPASAGEDGVKIPVRPIVAEPDISSEVNRFINGD